MKVEQTKILHISPTDIRYDSRILKEINSLKKIDNCFIKAFGISENEGHNYKNHSTNHIVSFTLISKKFKFLPRPIRYSIAGLEAFILMIIPIIKFKPKIIHCHDTLFLPLGVFSKIFLGSVLVYDAHELESDKAGQNIILKKATLFLEWLSWRHINLLISVSPSIIIWYEKKFGIKQNLLILNSPFINNESNIKNTDYLRHRFDIPDNSKIFLYNGILSKEGRGIVFLLDYFSRSGTSSHIVFLGYGELENDIKDYQGKVKNIHHHPSVPHQNVVAISQSADIGLCMVESVSLSDYYCLPNKLFEYAFSGIPIIASNLPDIKTIVEDYSLGLCCDLDINSFDFAVKVFESNSYQKREIDIFQLSWEFQEIKLIKQYNHLINQ